MLAVLALCIVAFLGLIGGLGLLVASRLSLAPSERLVAVVLAGQGVLYLAGTVFYLARVPAEYWLLLSLPAVAGWWCARRELRAWSAHADVRRMLAGWSIVVAGGLVALALIRNYSGGDWIGDWVGHYHRAIHFLRQDPNDAWIFALDPMTARPPLQNIVTAVLLAFTPATFAHYQVFTLLLGSMAVLPLGLLVASLGAGGRASSWLILLLLVNPMWVQNVTYSWTKLGCAAWVLAGIAFMVRARESEKLWLLAALALSAGVLTHYSAAPYFLVLSALYFCHHRRRWRDVAFWRQSVIIGAAMAMLLTSWFGWAVARYGWSATAGANTTAGYLRAMTWPEQVTAFWQNLLYTLVPPVLLPVDSSILTHANLAATVRDWAFAVYQTCLPFMVGTGALLALSWRFLQTDSSLRPRLRRNGGVLAAVLAIVALSVAAHAARVRWGVGHIGLQPLALAALTVAAGFVASAPRRIQIIVVAGLLFDAVLGVGLHLGVEHLAVPPAVVALDGGAPLRALYGLGFAANATAKHALGLTLLGDMAPSAWALAPLFAAGVGFTLRRCFAPAQAAVASSPPARAESSP